MTQRYVVMPYYDTPTQQTLYVVYDVVWHGYLRYAKFIDMAYQTSESGAKMGYVKAKTLAYRLNNGEILKANGIP